MAARQIARRVEPETEADERRMHVIDDEEADFEEVEDEEESEQGLDDDDDPDEDVEDDVDDEGGSEGKEDEELDEEDEEGNQTDSEDGERQNGKEDAGEVRASDDEDDDEENEEEDDMMVVDQTALRLRKLDGISQSLSSIQWRPFLPPPLSSSHLSLPLPLSSPTNRRVLIVRPSLREDGKQRSGAVLVTIAEEGEEEEGEEEGEGFERSLESEGTLKPALRSEPRHESGDFGGNVYDWLTGRVTRETAQAQLRGRDGEEISGRIPGGGEALAGRGIEGDDEASRPVSAAVAEAKGAAKQRTGKAAGGTALAAAESGRTMADQSRLAGQKTTKGRAAKADARERVLATAGGVMREVEGQFMVAPWHPVKLAKIKKAAAPDTAGAKWFHLPAKELTPEVKRELNMLQLRHVLDPKRHYRASDSKKPPKHFQIGTVVEGAADFYSARLTRRERKQTLAEEILSDQQTKAYRKRKYMELQAAGEQKGKKRLSRKDDRKKPVWARSAPK